MRNVDEQIEQWRNGLAESELLAGSDVSELENHLRDEMGHLKTSGLSDEETFLVARRRLGDTAALADEFAKVNGSRRLTNHLWGMIAGVLACLLAVHFADVGSLASRAVTQATDLGPSVRALIAGAVHVGAFCAVGALALRLCLRCRRPAIRPPIYILGRVRMAVLLALLVEILGLAINRMFGVPRPGHAWTANLAQDYAHFVATESLGVATWRLMGPVLLGALLIVIHLAGRQKAETQ